MDVPKPPEDLPPGYHFDPQFRPVRPIYFGYDVELREFVTVDMSKPEDVARYGTDPEQIRASLAPTSNCWPTKPANFSESLARTLVTCIGEIHTAASLLELTFPEEIAELYRNGDTNTIYNKAGRVLQVISQYAPDKYLPETHVIQRGLQIAKDGKKLKPSVRVLRSLLVSQAVETGDIPDGCYTIRWNPLHPSSMKRL